VRQFFWDEFCDWYVEMKKLRFQEGSGLNAEWRNMLTVFEAALRLLHPVMPFLTEELWQRLATNAKNRPASISLAAFPQAEPASNDPAAEADILLLQEIIGAVRNLRSEIKADPKEMLTGSLHSSGRALELAGDYSEAIAKLAGIKLELSSAPAPKRQGGAVRSTTQFDLILEVPQAQLEAQRKRLEKELVQLEKNIANSRRQLSDETFVSRAPETVVSGIKNKLAEYEAQLEKSKAALESF
jgi:valyl-tRNA synthetase